MYVPLFSWQLSLVSASETVFEDLAPIRVVHID